MRSKTIILLLSAFFSFHGFSQKGILSGKVIDEKTGEELIGTTVVVSGTTMGAITDFDGNYLLELDPGTYSITCSYISYQTQVFEGIEIKADEVTELNIQMGEVTTELEEVKIVAKGRQRTEAALQVLQRKSAIVLDGISSSQISKMGDSDAAGALKRVTGVSVESGKYVYVRGLSDRYSKTTLNGGEVPGLDPNRNTVQMDLFPGNIIENIVVHKTFSPDLPGDFTGGHVDVVTMDFPIRFNLQFSAKLEYNPQASLQDQFLGYEGGTLDWLGFDDGTRDIPAPAQGQIHPDFPYGQIPPKFVDDPLLDQVTKSFNKQMEPLPQTSFLNQSYSLSMGDQVSTGSRVLGYNLAISYSNEYDYFDNGSVGRYKLIDPGDPNLSGQLTLDKDRKGVQNVLWSALGNINLKLNEKNKIGLLLMHNHSGISTGRFQEGEKSSDEAGLFYQTRTLQYLERGLSSAQLHGEHVAESWGMLKFRWLSSFTYSTQDEPDLRYFTNSYNIIGGNPVYEIAPSIYPVPTRYWREMREYNFNNKLDAELPFRFAGNASKLLVGGSMVIKNRTFREQKFSFPENSNSYMGDIPQYLQDDNMDHILRGDGRLIVQNSLRQNNINSYDGYQSVFAGYLSADMGLTKKLRMIAGARLEYAYIFSESLETSLEKGELDNVDVLPSMNLIYAITDKMNLRGAYYRTLARPSFRELAPFASFDFVGDYIFIGNANLKRTLIDNFDIRWEFFMSPGEMISLSGFYKKFTDPIERTFNTEAANPELTLRNVDEASVLGFELELRKSLDFISFLRDFMIGGNVALVQSVVSIDEAELQRKRLFDPEFPDTRVMFGQAPFIVNTYLEYNNDSIGLSVNLAYNTNGKRLSLVNAQGIPDVYEQPRGQFDFNIAKTLGRRFTLKLAVKNILDDDYWSSYYYNGIHYNFEKYATGRYYSIGIKYAIK
jgi:outer membrane receptor protein involved in Fe transport